MFVSLVKLSSLKNDYVQINIHVKIFWWLKDSPFPCFQKEFLQILHSKAKRWIPFKQTSDTEVILTYLDLYLLHFYFFFIKSLPVCCANCRVSICKKKKSLLQVVNACFCV